MATGKPNDPLDFCNEERSYPILARTGRFPGKRVGDIATIDHPWLAEPDAAIVRHLMQRVVADLGEARRKGRAASQRIRSRFTWANAVDAAERRLEVPARG